MRPSGGVVSVAEHPLDVNPSVDDVRWPLWFPSPRDVGSLNEPTSLRVPRLGVTTLWGTTSERLPSMANGSVVRRFAERAFLACRLAP